MSDQSKNENPQQSSPPPPPPQPLPKVDPAKTISYRQDGADKKS
jgi:hypothetical protein